MAIKVNARETELKFGKEATYHSAMIWKMKQIRRFLRHKKGTQIPWITQILLIDNRKRSRPNLSEASKKEHVHFLHKLTPCQVLPLYRNSSLERSSIPF